MKHAPEYHKGSWIKQQWSGGNEPEEHAGFELLDDVEYEVRWPEHVHNKRFNGDCTIYPND